MDEDEIPERLFYFKTSTTPLRVVVALNNSQAAQIVGVHPSSMLRYGAVWDPDTGNGPEEIGHIAQAAFAERGAVFELRDGAWKQCSGVAAANRIKHQVERGIAARRGPRSPGGRAPVRVLKLTKEEIDTFKKKGGAKWLREQIQQCQPGSVDTSKRRRGEELKQIPVRVNDYEWGRFMDCGGVHFLRKLLDKSKDEGPKHD